MASQRLAHAQSGVTLLELTLVLLLIVLLSGLVAPRLWTRGVDDPLEASARRLTGIIAQAGDLARRDQRPVGLSIERGNQFILRQLPYEATSAPVVTYTLPREIQLRQFVGGGDGRAHGAREELLFSPKGHVAPAAIILADRRGHALRLAVEPFLATVSLHRADGRHGEQLP